MMFGVLILLAAVTGGLWIDVPFIKQQKDGCGSAAIWMIMQYWNKSPAPAEEIHRTLFSPEAGGVFASDMESYFVQHGFKTFVFVGEWKDLVDHVSNGRPLIVSLGASSRGAPLHYVVVAGVLESQETVLINDPARRKLWPMTRSEFEKRWTEMGRWTLLALPEEPLAESSVQEPASMPAASSELIEATAAFREAKYDEARMLASRAIELHPTDRVANDLVATVYFLQGNVEAALKYWNRVDEPRVRDIVLDPDTRWNPILLERAIPLSRSSFLRLEDYTLSRKRLEATRTFSRYAIDLKPTEGSDFDVRLRAEDRGGSHWASWLRGLPYSTVAPEFANIRGRGINVESLWRWDPSKRRAFAQVSMPGGEGLRYRAGFDLRDEQWDWNGNRFGLRRQELNAGLTHVATDKLTWSTGASVSRLSAGFTLKYRAGAEFDLWTVPERRLSVTSGIRSELGSVLSRDRRFARVEPALGLHWLPQSRGDDYETAVKIRAGRFWGDPPFDEFFSIGLDRDSDLRMRAHPATHEGRKGAGLISTRYFLMNSEVAKRLVDFSLVRVKLAPFADVARVGRWYVDPGIEARFSIASLFTISFSVGRDTRTGRNVFFADASK